ncbi:MAG: trypsin-like peptidase domain-containing protein [Pseudomonadales bacterium]|nr:trypsin-like peptidase domain-containing protein [Pseudomonadales bacterium]
MSQLLRFIQFAGWPVVCGVLVAVVYLQYQQLQELASLRSNQTPVIQQVPQAVTSYAEAIRRAAPSVVSITATSVNVESVERAAEDRLNLYLGESNSLGSGVIIDQRGFILTNLHVVDTLFDAFDTQVTLHDGRRTPATVVAWDKTNDLAVLHINMDDLTPIEISEDNSVHVGDIVFAIGYPRNIGQAVSQGIVSAVSGNDSNTLPIIQTDAAINPGNSGGALINTEGELIGINSSIVSESGTFEGIGFATPASVAVPAMEEMIVQAIEANSGYLGVLTGEALNEQSSELFFGVEHIRGILVENVDEGGAAQRAGIQPGDVITGVGETPVTDAQNIMMEIRNKKPGDTIEVQIYRNGQTFTLPTTLGFGQAIIIEP